MHFIGDINPFLSCKNVKKVICFIKSSYKKSVLYFVALNSQTIFVSDSTTVSKGTKCKILKQLLHFVKPLSTHIW